MKKVLSLILAFVMVVAMVPAVDISVNAIYGNELMYVEQEQIGDTVTFYIYVNEGIPFSGIINHIKFDSTALSPNSYEMCGEYANSINTGGIATAVSDDIYCVAFVNLSSTEWDSTTNGSLIAKVIFDIKESSSSETDIGFYCAEFCSSDENYNVPNNLTNPMFIESITVNGANVIYEIGLCYEVVDNKATVVACDTTANEIIIPDRINGFPVVALTADALDECYSLESITLSKNITKFAKNTFKHCANLKKVNYSGTVNQWAKIQFAYTQDESDTVSFSNPLYYSEDLYIKDQLVTSIVFDSTVNEIAPYTFYHCKSIELITIPDSIKDIGEKAFAETAYYNNKENWDNNVLYIGTHLIECKSSVSGGYEIKDGTVTIAESAFKQCNNLTSITIPDSVKLICCMAIPINVAIKASCDSCAVEYAENNGVVINKIHNKIGIMPAVAPTCTETGLTEGSRCSACGTIFIEQKIVDALGHIIVEDSYVAPTCTEIGLTNGNHCSTCGEVFVEQAIIDALGHTMVVDPAVSPTCTETGLTEGSHCSICDIVLVEQEVISATGHIYENFMCTGCNKYLETDHVYSDNQDITWNLREENATCIAITFSDLTKTELNYDYIYIYNSMGEQLGKYSGTSLAGKRVVVAGDSIEIRFSSDNSSVDYGFAITNIEYFYEHTPEIDAAVFPSCTETGLTEGSHCAECGTILIAQQTVPVLAHKPIVDSAVEPTCTKTGLTEGSHCSVCRMVIVSQNEIPASGHIYDDGEVVKVPTCTENGIKIFTCERCNWIESQEVEEKGHTIVKDAAIAPSCGAVGLTEGSHCSSCGDILVEQQVIEAIGHNIVTTPAVAPTATDFGLTEGYHCSNCGLIFKEQEPIRPLGYTINLDSEKVFACYDDTILFAPAGDTVTYQWYATNSESGTPSVTVRGATDSAFSPMDYYGGGNEGKYKYYYCVANVEINGVKLQTTSSMCLNAFALMEESDYSIVDYENSVIYTDSINNLNDYSNIISIDAAEGLTTTFAPSYQYGETKSYGTGTTVTLQGSGDGKTVFTVIVYGDTNGDSAVDVLDAAAVAKVSTNQATLDGVYSVAADINGDGNIDVNDYSAVVNKAVA